MYFLNINKPKGMTSFDVIRNLRKKLNIKAIGHSGTLDPMASGVLQVAVGSATKLLDYLKSDKTYVATIKFGFISDTYDAEGKIEEIKKPDFSLEELNRTLQGFVGKTSQVPPKYSAIKQNGRKLCDIARKNPDCEIKIEAREIEIYSIKLLEFSGFDLAKIEVHCKKGTYIRSLANDLGKKLGCGAYLAGLIRTQAGNFKIENANNLEDELIPLNPLDVLDYERYELTNEQYQRVINGNSIKIPKMPQKDIVLLTKDNKLVSIANLSDNLNGESLIKPKKTFRD